MMLPGDTADLTYCTNIHPGETWGEIQANLTTFVPPLKRKVAHDRAFGLGLRVSAAAALALEDEAERQAFRDWLSAHDLYVRTLNGFPYGRFHGATVKEGVYRPDWSEMARVDYTLSLIRLLAALLPPGRTGNISTVPGCYRERATPQRRDEIIAHLVGIGTALHELALASGTEITLALEAEPDCMLETTQEAVAFLEQHVFSGLGLRLARARIGGSPGEVEGALRRHIGLCLDLCHAAVEYEDPTACVRGPGAAGIRIAKVQISSGLRIVGMTPEKVVQLRTFADPVYLHQVVTHDAAGNYRRFRDLPEALDAAEHSTVGNRSEEWRIHFHVPIFRRAMGPFETTQGFLETALSELRRLHASDCLEVETYTWEVLPQQFQAGSVVEAIAAELEWAAQQWGP